MTETSGPLPLTYTQWVDRNIKIGLGIYFAHINACHRRWQEMVGLR